MCATHAGGGANVPSLLVFVFGHVHSYPLLVAEGMRNFLFLCLYGFDSFLYFLKLWLFLTLLIFYH